MKTDLNPAGHTLRPQELGAKSSNKQSANPLPGNLTPMGSPDYKVDLSGKTPAPSTGGLPTLSLSALPLPPAPPAPSLPSLPQRQAREVTKDLIKEEAQEKIKEVKKPEEKEGSVKKPAIIFIKGLDVFSSPLKSESGYAGLGRIAEAVPGSRLYGWDQKDEILKQIKKVHKDYPVILVGHSLGGDTALKIANELDSLKEGFRKIDLLVTMDAVGFSSEIIPQNVKKHLNVFGENSWFLNGSPHVARRDEMTQVKNILSPLDHTDIDDDREVQFEVVNLIKESLPA